MFSADAAASGRYTIAVLSGGNVKTADVGVTAGDPPTVAFTFP